MTRLATLNRSFPTVRAIAAPFRWIGKSRRRLWCARLVLLVMVAGPPLIWELQLWGLPEIGEPFDVRAFREMTIPDDRNAFVLYRQAAASLKPLGQYVKGSFFTESNWSAGWKSTTPEVRRWAEDNREALALFRQGTDRPDALDPSLAFPHDHKEFSWKIECLKRLVYLEAARLEEQGDMAGAWGWYRAVLRLIHQVGLHGSLESRLHARDWHYQLRRSLTAWAHDPRTSATELRKSLDDAIACESMVPSESYTLKAEYLDIERWFDNPGSPGHQPTATFRNLGGPSFELSPEQVQVIWDVWRFGRRETVRSRRVIRLLTSNWLAYLELPRDRRPSPSLNVSGGDIYPFGPEAPSKARALSPEALDRWLGTTIDAQQLLPRLGWIAIWRMESNATPAALGPAERRALPTRARHRSARPPNRGPARRIRRAGRANTPAGW